MRSAGWVDPGWQHGVAQDSQKKKVKCNYCGKMVSGGIFRLKQHLAKISGEVTHCESAPEQVCLNMRKNLEGCCSNRKRRLCPETSTSLSVVHDSTKTLIAYELTDGKIGGNASTTVKSPPLRALGYVTDPGWEHCVSQDQKKKKVTCNYCNKMISGGINRFKQHLAKIPGEVAYCDRVPEDVYLKIKENMKWHRSGRQHSKSDGKGICQFYTPLENEVEKDEGILPCTSRDIVGHDEKHLVCHNNSTDKEKNVGGSSTGPKPPMRLRLDSVFIHSVKDAPSSPPEKLIRMCEPVKTGHNEVISAICDFFYHAGVPPSDADSPYFKRMLELVGQYGEGLKSPSGEFISSQFSLDEISPSVTADLGRDGLTSPMLPTTLLVRESGAGEYANGSLAASFNSTAASGALLDETRNPPYSTQEVSNHDVEQLVNNDVKEDYFNDNEMEGGDERAKGG